MEPVFSFRGLGRAVSADSPPRRVRLGASQRTQLLGEAGSLARGPGAVIFLPPGPDASGQGHDEDIRTHRLTRHSRSASPQAGMSSPEASVLGGWGPCYTARLRSTLISSAGHRMGAAAPEADELLGPRLVVLSVSQGDANSIRVPGMTEVGREGREGGGDVSVSRDGVPLPTQIDACLLGA